MVLAVLGLWLDLMILKVFSSLNDSMIIQLYGKNSLPLPPEESCLWLPWLFSTLVGLARAMCLLLPQCPFRCAHASAAFSNFGAFSRALQTPCQPWHWTSPSTVSLSKFRKSNSPTSGFQQPWHSTEAELFIFKIIFEIKMWSAFLFSVMWLDSWFFACSQHAKFST